MKEYVGIKKVRAMSQTWNKYCREAPGADPGQVSEERQEGYQVVSPSGSVSWLPRDEFEGSFQAVEERMCFSRALFLMQQGVRCFRRDHIKQGILQYVAIAVVDEPDGPDDPNTEPYLYMAQGKGCEWRVPTTLTNQDILADDWLVVG